MQALLTLISLALAFQGALVAAAPLSQKEPRAATSLNAMFKAKGKKYWGNIADPGATLNTAANTNILKAQFGQLTPENSLKWDQTEPQQGKFTLGNAQQLVNFATQNGMLIRGHTLVWHSQLPAFVSAIKDKTQLTNAINSHIKGVMTPFKGKMYAWDVVNEMFNENGSLRSSVFSNVLGEDFVRIAFEAAKANDPNTKRYINDFNLDSNNAKVKGLVALVGRVNAKNPGLIQGIGSQTHLGAGQVGGVQAALTALAAAPVEEVAITELDIAQASANDYVTVAKACLAVPKCVGITSWGVSDKLTWRPGENPDLFDANFKQKAAVNALLAL